MDDSLINAYAGFNALAFILKGHIRQSLEDAPLPIAKLTKLKDDLLLTIQKGEWPLETPEPQKQVIRERFDKIFNVIFDDLAQYAQYLENQRLEKNRE